MTKKIDQTSQKPVECCFIYEKYRNTCIQNGLKYENFEKVAQVQPFRPSGQKPCYCLCFFGSRLHLAICLVRACLVLFSFNNIRREHENTSSAFLEIAFSYFSTFFFNNLFLVNIILIVSFSQFRRNDNNKNIMFPKFLVILYKLFS